MLTYIRRAVTVKNRKVVEQLVAGYLSAARSPSEARRGREVGRGADIPGGGGEEGLSAAEGAERGAQGGAADRRRGGLRSRSRLSYGYPRPKRSGLECPFVGKNGRVRVGDPRFRY